jgi:hypothetical protein
MLLQGLGTAARLHPPKRKLRCHDDLGLSRLEGRRKFSRPIGTTKHDEDHVVLVMSHVACSPVSTLIETKLIPGWQRLRIQATRDGGDGSFMQFCHAGFRRWAVIRWHDKVFSSCRHRFTLRIGRAAAPSRQRGYVSDDKGHGAVASFTDGSKRLAQMEASDWQMDASDWQMDASDWRHVR